MGGYVVLDALEVAIVKLHVYRGQHLNFEVRWWADELRTDGVELASARSQARTKSGELVMDLNPSVEGNAAIVSCSAAAVDALVWPDEPVKWDIQVTSTEGEQKVLARGPVRLHEGSTV